MGLCQSKDARSTGAVLSSTTSPAKLIRTRLLRQNSEQSITIIPEAMDEDDEDIAWPQKHSRPKRRPSGEHVWSPDPTEVTTKTSSSASLSSPLPAPPVAAVSTTVMIEEEEEEEEVAEQENIDPSRVDLTVSSLASSLHSLVCTTTDTIEEEVDPTCPSDEEDYHEMVEQEEPGRLVISKLQRAHITNPKSAALVAPARHSQNDTSSILSPILGQDDPSSIHPQTLSHFARVKLQVKLQKQQQAKLKQVQKYQDRYQDVQGYKQLWREYQTLQTKLQEEKKDAPAEGQEDDAPPTTKKKKRRKSFDLKDSNHWFFDFQAVNFGYENDLDDNDLAKNQTSLSLHSESSLEAQRRLFAEKRRLRKRSKKKQDASSVGNSSMVSFSSQASNDYGPLERRMLRPASSVDIDDDNAAAVDGNSVLSEDYEYVGPGGSLCSGNDYRVMRRRRRTEDNSAKLSWLEKRIQALKAKEEKEEESDKVASPPVEKPEMAAPVVYSVKSETSRDGTVQSFNSNTGGSSLKVIALASRDDANTTSAPSPLSASHLIKRFNRAAKRSSEKEVAPRAVADEEEKKEEGDSDDEDDAYLPTPLYRVPGSFPSLDDDVQCEMMAVSGKNADVSDDDEEDMILSADNVGDSVATENDDVFEKLLAGDESEVELSKDDGPISSEPDEDLAALGQRGLEPDDHDSDVLGPSDPPAPKMPSFSRSGHNVVLETRIKKDAPGECLSQGFYGDKSDDEARSKDSPGRLPFSSSPKIKSPKKCMWVANLSTNDFLRLSEENALERAARMEHNEEVRPEPSLVETYSSESDELLPDDCIGFDPPAETSEVEEGYQTDSATKSLILASQVEAQVNDVLNNFRQSLGTPESEMKAMRIFEDAPEDEKTLHVA